MSGMEELYRNIDEKNRLVSSRAGNLEFWTSMRVLERHVRPGSDILETGSGSGRYASAFAKLGHRVTATDIVPAHLPAIRALAAGEGAELAGVELRDAVDLSAYADGSFDVVLCLGPYYHLRTRAERAACLSESRRVLVKDGILALAYVNRAFAVINYVRNGIFFDSGLYRDLLAPDHAFRSGRDAFLDRSFLASPEDVVAETGAAGFVTLDHAGTDGMAGLVSRQLEAMGEAEWEAFREHHLATCRNPSTLGASSHGLVVCARSRAPDRDCGG